jgi:hypothetical protein
VKSLLYRIAVYSILPPPINTHTENWDQETLSICEVVGNIRKTCSDPKQNFCISR